MMDTYRTQNAYQLHAGAPILMTFPRQRLFWSVSLGHFTIDTFNGMGPVLLTFLSGHVMSLTNTQIGFAVSAYQLVAAFSQPFFGYLTDKTGGRWLGAGGLAWTVSLLMTALLLSMTGQYILLLIPYVLAALGSGAFHPVGTFHAADSDQKRATSNLSIFFLMGQLGGGLGPALVGALLDSTATHNSVFTRALGPAFSGMLVEHGTVSPLLAMSLIAIPAILFMAFAIPGMTAFAHQQHQAANTSPAGRAPVSRFALIMLVVVVTLRSLANPGMVAFIPRLFALKGWTAAEYGLITSTFWIAGGIAGVIFGQIAERYGTTRIISATLMLGALPIFLLPLADGQLAFALTLAAGALTSASHSLIVALAQRIIPMGKGLASGAALGFIFGTGAIGTLVIGTMSDRLTLGVAFQIVGVVTFITGLLAVALPSERAAPHLRPDHEPVEAVAEAIT
jgi:FSR family fosmidomycin resistance protein-like MFS transporter